jgi:hypothetical protein
MRISALLQGSRGVVTSQVTPNLNRRLRRSPDRAAELLPTEGLQSDGTRFAACAYSVRRFYSIDSRAF